MINLSFEVGTPTLTNEEMAFFIENFPNLEEQKDPPSQGIDQLSLASVNQIEGASLSNDPNSFELLQAHQLISLQTPQNSFQYIFPPVSPAFDPNLGSVSSQQGQTSFNIQSVNPLLGQELNPVASENEGIPSKKKGKNKRSKTDKRVEKSVSPGQKEELSSEEKAMRRKLRNRMSAQESRERQKEALERGQKISNKSSEVFNNIIKRMKKNPTIFPQFRGMQQPILSNDSNIKEVNQLSFIQDVFFQLVQDYSDLQNKLASGSNGSLYQNLQ